MLENENRSIFLIRRKVIDFYYDKYRNARSNYIDILDSLMAFTSLINYKRIELEEVGKVRCHDDVVDLFATFGDENATRLLDLVNDVNKYFDIMHECYVSYFVKKKQLGF